VNILTICGLFASFALKRGRGLSLALLHGRTNHYFCFILVVDITQISNALVFWVHIINIIYIYIYTHIFASLYSRSPEKILVIRICALTLHGIYSSGVKAASRHARYEAHVTMHASRCTRHDAHVKMHASRCTSCDARFAIHVLRCTLFRTRRDQTAVPWMMTFVSLSSSSGSVGQPGGPHPGSVHRAAAGQEARRVSQRPHRHSLPVPG